MEQTWRAFKNSVIWSNWIVAVNTSCDYLRLMLAWKKILDWILNLCISWVIFQILLKIFSFFSLAFHFLFIAQKSYLESKSLTHHSLLHHRRLQIRSRPQHRRWAPHTQQKPIETQWTIKKKNLTQDTPVGMISFTKQVDTFMIL